MDDQNPNDETMMMNVYVVLLCDSNIESVDKILKFVI